MKWLLALISLVAAAPALPTYEGGDAPDPGQVIHLQRSAVCTIADYFRSKSSRLAREVLVVLQELSVPSSRTTKVS